MDRLHADPSGDVSSPERVADVTTCLRGFLAEHHTLVLATEVDGQPWCTRVFFAEAYRDNGCPILYLLAKTPSRKLANLEANDRVGVFIGPEQPTAWLEARGRATVLRDPTDDTAARALVVAKSPEAGPFLARVTAEVVRIHLEWLRFTDVIATPRRVIEVEGDAAEA